MPFSKHFQNICDYENYTVQYFVARNNFLQILIISFLHFGADSTTFLPNNKTPVYCHMQCILSSFCCGESFLIFNLNCKKRWFHHSGSLACLYFRRFVFNFLYKIKNCNMPHFVASTFLSKNLRSLKFFRKKAQTSIQHTFSCNMFMYM